MPLALLSDDCPAQKGERLLVRLPLCVTPIHSFGPPIHSPFLPSALRLCCTKDALVLSMVLCSVRLLPPELASHTSDEVLYRLRGLSPKHAIKQVDRLFSNELLSVEDLVLYWLEFVSEVALISWSHWTGQSSPKSDQAARWFCP